MANSLSMTHTGECEEISDLLSTEIMGKYDEERSPITRWMGNFRQIFSVLAKSVARFCVSHIKNEETENFQSAARSIFSRTTYIDKIKENCDLQNVFMLGYCHALNEVTKDFEEEIKYMENDTLKDVVRAYKNVGPILYALDKNFKMSHKELSEDIGISTTALSNCLRRVKKYELFNSQKIGNKSFYSLAYPNGMEALKILKDKEKPSAEGYTDFLLELFGTLKEIGLKKDYDADRLKKIEENMARFTVKPALCKKQVKDIALMLKQENVSCALLLLCEGSVEKRVTVFTRKIQSEKYFAPKVRENLRKDILYQWLILDEDGSITEEDAKKRIIMQIWGEELKSNKNEIDKASENISIYIIPKKEESKLFRTSTDMLISDAVIYDQKRGYECIDEQISGDSRYTSIGSRELANLKQYANKKLSSKLRVGVQ